MQCRQCGSGQSMAMKFCPRCGTKFESDVVPCSSVTYKVVILGPGSVGKSSITIQYVYRQFQSIYDPTIEDKYSKIIEYNGIMLNTKDTAGQETFHCMRDLYFRNGHAFAIVYSIIAENTFEEAIKIIPAMYQSRGGEQDLGTIPIVLVGNKVDLEKRRIISSSEGKEAAARWGASFIESSAKQNINVVDIFTTMIDDIWKINGLPMAEKKKKSAGCFLF